MIDVTFQTLDSLPGDTTMTRPVIALLALALVAFANVAQAQEKADPTGTWKWMVRGQNDQMREQTLKLKLEGDKLTGAMLGRNNRETAIENAKYKDGEVSFDVTVERGGNKLTSKYSGKVSGDTIKGKMAFERDGQKRERDWEAKRAKT